MRVEGEGVCVRVEKRREMFECGRRGCVCEKRSDMCESAEKEGDMYECV